jgi:hypothetical protein
MYNRSSIAGQHSLQSCQSSVYVAQVRDFRDSLELHRRHLLDGRKHRGHSVVDPDIDWPEPSLHFPSRRLHLLRIRHIGRQEQSSATRCRHFAGRGPQAIPAASH